MRVTGSDSYALMFLLTTAAAAVVVVVVDDADAADNGCDDDEDVDVVVVGTVSGSLPPAATCITQPAQRVSTIHYAMNGHPLFAWHCPSDVSRPPGNMTAALPPSLDHTPAAKPRSSSPPTSVRPSLPGAVEDDEDDEKIWAVMNAIRPMHPAYCVPGSKELDQEMANVIRNSVVTTTTNL